MLELNVEANTLSPNFPRRIRSPFQERMAQHLPGANRWIDLGDREL